MPQIIVKLGESVVQKFSFDKPIVLIGRALDNDLVVEHLSVSRRHAQIEWIDGKYQITDLNSANGTFVDGVRIQKHSLKDQDVVVVGKHKLFFLEDVKQEELMPASPFDFDKTVVVQRVEPCYFVVMEGKTTNQTFRVDKPEAFIGRDAECDVVIHDWLAAKKHARLNLVGKNYVITDLGTWKGTKINGQSVKERILLNKDIVEIGLTKLRFLSGSGGDSDFVLKSTPPVKEIGSVKSVAVEQESKPLILQQDYSTQRSKKGEYVASRTSPVFHFITCNWAKGIKEDRRIYFKNVGEAILSRRRSCVSCKPGMENKDVEFWIKVSQDEDDSVRAHAAKMLKKLTGKDHV